MNELVAAIRAGAAAEAARILDREPSLVETLTDDRSPLHEAVAANQPAIVRLLLERGADPDTRDGDGRLPLHDCIALGRDAIATILLAAGGTIDVCAAAALGRHDKLAALLVADPDLANDMTTHLAPLGWAAYARDEQSARILCQHGAVVGRPPFDCDAWVPAAEAGAAAVARVLLDHGADPDWQDDDGNTPLHLALAGADPGPFVATLVAAGADLGRENRAGRTPLDEARARGLEGLFSPAR
jgi:ankyrin repeat protein